jgi:diacylglycerol kinase family enzyme
MIQSGATFLLMLISTIAKTSSHFWILVARRDGWRGQAHRLRPVDRVAVVYNPRSGALLARADEAPGEQLKEIFAERGVPAEFRPFALDTLAADLRELLNGKPDAVIVAGGDGTVSSIAERMLGSDIPLGVLPGGTMNVLAHDLGVPKELDRAVDALLDAPVENIDVGTVNGKPFLCGSSLAMMPHLGRLRERARGTVGLTAVKMLGRFLRLLWRYPRMRLTIVVDGREYEVRTRAVVVSLNALAAGPPPRPGRIRLDGGTIAVYVTHDRTNWDLIAVATKLFRGNWQQDPRIRKYEGPTVEIRSANFQLLTVMTDGEIAQLELPLRFEVRPRALPVLAPHAAGR